MDSRRKEKKRDRRKRRLLKRREALNHSNLVVVAPPGQAKMSEVILEFIEPYSEHWRTEEQLEKLLLLATVAWNAALFPDSKRNGFIQDMVETVAPEARQDMRSIVEEMIQRKETYFA